MAGHDALGRSEAGGTRRWSGHVDTMRLRAKRRRAATLERILVHGDLHVQNLPFLPYSHERLLARHKSAVPLMLQRVLARINLNQCHVRRLRPKFA